MAVFQPHYEVFGQVMQCNVVHLPNPLKLETGIYRFLKPVVQADGWKYSRIDTTDQQGWPDVTLLRGQEYNLIECKMLKKVRLQDILNDIHFEFGQVPFMARSLSLKLNYTLAVGKGHKLAFIQGSYNPWTIPY